MLVGYDNCNYHAEFAKDMQGMEEGYRSATLQHHRSLLLDFSELKRAWDGLLGTSSCVAELIRGVEVDLVVSDNQLVDYHLHMDGSLVVNQPLCSVFCDLFFQH